MDYPAYFLSAGTGPNGYKQLPNVTKGEGTSSLTITFANFDTNT